METEWGKRVYAVGTRAGLHSVGGIGAGMTELHGILEHCAAGQACVFLFLTA